MSPNTNTMDTTAMSKSTNEITTYKFHDNSIVCDSVISMGGGFLLSILVQTQQLHLKWIHINGSRRHFTQGYQ